MYSKSRVMHYPDNLSWVNMQKPADIRDTRTAKIIRSHAQREVRRRERLTKTKTLSRRNQKAGTLHQDVASGEPVSQVAFDVEDVEHCEELSIPPAVAQRPLEAFEVALARSNPFTKGPPPQSLFLHQRISRYMNNWHGEYASNVCGGDPDDRWKSHLPTADTEDVVLYAQAFYSTSLETWSHQSNALGLLALKHQAILHINHNLNDPTLAVSNANMQSVLNLAHATHLENLGIEYYTTHMNGLRKIIALKGGWDEVRSEKLGDVLAMCDYVGATIFRTKLSYVPEEPRPLLPPPQFPPSFTQTSPLLSPGVPDQPSSVAELLQNISQLLTELRDLTTLFESYHGEPSLHDKGLTAALTPANITFSSSHSHEAASSSLNHQMCQSLYLASLIYVRAICHDIPFGDSINLDTMQLLRQTLKPTLLVGWRELPGALLWVLLVGMAAERDCGMGNMLAGYTSMICHCIGFRHWGAVREILQRFMAIEAKVDKRAASRVSRDGNGAC